MYVLGIMGSPRVGGNSDVLLEQALKGAAEKGARTEKIVLNELSISGCNDCTGCNETGVCVVEDDMQTILPRVREADYIIHAVPLYFWSMTAQMKAYLDRWCALYDADWKWQKEYLPEMTGKKIGLITLCGDQDTSICSPTEDVFKNLCKFCQMELVGCLQASAYARGEVEKNKDAMQAAFKLGQDNAS